MPADNQVIHVSVAVIQKADGTTLFAQRPTGKACAGEWEFPGGKIEAGETARQALTREIDEELGIHITKARPWITLAHQYPHAQVLLHFFIVTDWVGTEHPKEGQKLSWQMLSNLNISPLLAANGPVIKALQLPQIYAISCAKKIGEQDFLQHLTDAINNGLRLLQIREKEMTACELKRFVDQVLPMTVPAGVKVLINSSVSHEQQLRFSGLHLNSNHLMSLDTRPNFETVAASCHNQLEVDQAIKLSLDFVVLSPILKTATHPDAIPLGYEKMQKIISKCPIPVYALGGMTADHLKDVQQHGAHGIAMLRAAWK